MKIARLCMLLVAVGIALWLPAQMPGEGRKMISNGFAVLSTDTLKALRIFEEAAFKANKEGDKKTAAEAFRHSAHVSLMLYKPLTAVRHFQESARVYESAGMQEDAAKMYHELGKVQDDMASFNDALASFRKSDEIAKNENAPDILADNLVASGMVLSRMGQWAKAQKNFVLALESYASRQDSAGMGDAWNGIGVVHWKEGKLPEAKAAYGKSLAFRLAVADSAGIATSYSNLGIICRLEKHYEDGLDYYRMALRIREGLNDLPRMAKVLFNTGSLLTDMGRNEEGLEYYARSFAIKKKTGDNYGLLSHYLNTGELFGEMGKPNEQVAAYLKGLALADSLHADDYIKSFTLSLSEYYASRAEYQSAYAYHLRHMEVKDTLLNRENRSQLTQLQAEYDLRDKQRDIDNLENKQAALEARDERNTVILGGIIVVAMFILMFAVYANNRGVELRKINEKLLSSKLLIEKREKEKEVLLREIHHRVKNNLQLTSSLLNLQARELKDSEAAQALKEARDRIKAISLVHQELYSGDSGGTVDLSGYLPSLCKSVTASNAGGTQITLDLKFDALHIPLDMSVSVGLMVNEIITNAIKHAFAGKQQGQIKVQAIAVDGNLQLIIQDNGNGIPQEVIEGSRSGFGLKLLRSLAVKLNAQLEIGNENGTEFKINIPKAIQT